MSSLQGSPSGKILSLDSIVESLNKVTIALERYLPIGEYALYQEYIVAFDSLVAKRDKQKQSYQNKAEYHRNITKKWRHNNKERNAIYQKQYYANNPIPKACHCEDKNKDNWYVVGKVKKRGQGNAPQTYIVKYDVCEARWKTKAKYCKELRQTMV